MKNLQQNTVLLPRTEYEKLSKAYEKTDNSNKTDIVDLVKRLPPMGNKKVYTLAQLKHDLNHNNELISKYSKEQDYLDR